MPASASCPALLAPPSTSPSPVSLFQVPAIEENLVDDKHLLKPWDAKKVGKGHWVSSTLPGTGLPGLPLRSVFISNPLPLSLSFPHPPLDLDPVKSLESSKYHYTAGVTLREEGDVED